MLEQLGISTLLVLSPTGNDIRAMVDDAQFKQVDFVIQEEQKGTGHAVAVTQDHWHADNLLILYGDGPLLTAEIITKFWQEHVSSNALLSFLTCDLDQPSGWGRVIQLPTGGFKIVEEKDCSPDEFKVSLSNSGIYLVNKTFLASCINTLTPSPVTGELYLTDIVECASRAGIVKTIQVPFDNVRGVNTLAELAQVEKIMRKRLVDYWMTHGVHFQDPENVYIDVTVTIGERTSIGAGVHLVGNTIIGNYCSILPGSYINSGKIESNMLVSAHSIIE